MVGTDWYTKTIEVLKSVAEIVWQGILWPTRVASSIPDWGKGIIFGLLVIAAILLGRYIYKSFKNQEWSFIDT